MLPQSHIAKSEEAEHWLTLSIKSDVADYISWEITTEQGESITGSKAINELNHVEYAKFDDAQFNKFALQIPKLEEGYHKLTVTLGDITDNCYLIFAPKTCYSPYEAADYKMWGLRGAVIFTY